MEPVHSGQTGSVIQKKVMSAKLKKGKMKWMSLDDITVAKWKDKRDVHVISNAHKPEMVPVANRRGVER